MITAIHGGGDWHDASADYLVLPSEVNYAAEERNWREWYRATYCPALRRGEHPVYLTLIEWLKQLGAREPTDEELTIREF